jgi:hypothetical protein
MIFDFSTASSCGIPRLRRKYRHLFKILTDFFQIWFFKKTEINNRQPAIDMGGFNITL